MAIGKANVKIKVNKLSINLGAIKIIDKGILSEKYDESIAKEYMKDERIDIKIDIGLGSKNFTAYTMDLTKKYIEINGDYRS